MAMNLTRKILAAHLAEPGDMIPGQEIFLHVDQTLTHDINAVMTYLAFEAIGLDRVRTEASRRMITSTCSRRPGATAYTSPGRETASAIRCIWPGSVRPADCP